VSAWLAAAGIAAAQAQGSATAAPPILGSRNVEVDPIRCWTRVSASAIRVGEPFTLTLTCAVLETDAVQVVPDESRLGPTVAQLSPFEVLGGTHPLDLRSGSRRFLQYEYSLRLIGPDAIGNDIPLPLIQINYRINSRVAANTATQGRELAYVLPTQYIRILSLVPDDANDIRDTRDANFNRIEAVAFRAGVLEIVAVTLVVLASLMTLFAIVGLVRRAAAAKGPRERLLGQPALMRLALRELTRAQRDGTDEGWTTGVVGRAAAAFRILAAGAVDKRISQRILEPGASGDDQAFVVSRTGVTRTGAGRRILVSSSITSAEVGRARGRAADRSARQLLLADIETTLGRLSAAQFGRNGSAGETVDVTVTKAIELARQVKSEKAWPWTWLRRLTGRQAPQPQPQT
jgi:hypothetical protein